MEGGKRTRTAAWPAWRQDWLQGALALEEVGLPWPQAGVAERIDLRRQWAVIWQVGCAVFLQNRARDPADFVRWVLARRREAGIEAERIRRWGPANPGLLVYYYAREMEALGVPCEVEAADGGCRIRHPIPAAWEEISRQFGLKAGTFSQFRRVYVDAVAQSYGLRTSWSAGGGWLTLETWPADGQAPRAAPNPPVPAPATQEQIAARLTGLVARHLSWLVGYACAAGSLPESAACELVSRGRAVFDPAEASGQPVRGLGGLMWLAEQIHLTLADAVELTADRHGYRLDSGAPSADVLPVLAYYGILPQDLARFFNGILGATALNHRVVAVVELGSGTFSTHIAIR